MIDRSVSSPIGFTAFLQRFVASVAFLCILLLGACYRSVPQKNLVGIYQLVTPSGPTETLFLFSDGRFRQNFGGKAHHGQWDYEREDSGRTWVVLRQRRDFGRGDETEGVITMLPASATRSGIRLSVNSDAGEYYEKQQ